MKVDRVTEGWIKDIPAVHVAMDSVKADGPGDRGLYKELDVATTSGLP